MSLIHSSTQQYHDQISQHSISIYYVSIRFQAIFGLKPELTQIHLLQSHIRHIHPTPFLHTFLCTCDRISPAATRPRSDFSSSSPLLAGLSASTPSSDSLLHVFSTLIASHIIWHQRGCDESRCLPSLAGAHYKNIKISRAERQGELMISLCHRCPSPPHPLQTRMVPGHLMQNK